MAQGLPEPILARKRSRSGDLKIQISILQPAL
jgi:hypothetical protein